MTKIQGISTDANQFFTISLPDGTSFQLTLLFKPLQQGWYMTVEYGDFQVSNMRVTTFYNILEQYTNQIPFGIGCITSAGQDPMFAQDFQSGNAALCVLDSVDIAAIEAYYAS